MKRIIGTVIEFPQRRNAKKTLVSFRININSQVVTPQRVCDLIARYRQHELLPEPSSELGIDSQIQTSTNSEKDSQSIAFEGFCQVFLHPKDNRHKIKGLPYL
jgi:hypothetical protein